MQLQHLLATLRAHPLQPGESWVHGCCTHIQLECKHRALKNCSINAISYHWKQRSCPSFPIQKVLWDGNAHKCLCRAVPPTEESCLWKESLLPIQPFLTEHSALWEIPTYYRPHFASSSKISLCNSQSQQLSHMNHIIFELHCSFTPYEILILSKPKRQWLLNQLEEFPSFSKWKSEIWAWFLQNHHFSQPR